MSGEIVGNPVLVVVDIQQGYAMPPSVCGIAHMEGYKERFEASLVVLEAAREAGVPVVHLQEVHRRNLSDMGRELDGSEGVHCLEGDVMTDFFEELRPIDGEFHVVKRRYSGFYSTELEIVLRAVRAETLFLIGGLTDVCIHYTFADAHQRDFHVRVIEDCVGGSSLQRHLASLDAMEYLQRGAVMHSDKVVALFKERALVLGGV